MTGAIDQIVGKLGTFAAATKRTQAQTGEYQRIVSGLADQFSRGEITADEYAERIGRVQGKFKGIGEAERMRSATAALAAAQAEAGEYAGVFDSAIEKVSVSVRAATPPLERLSTDLAANRQGFLAGTVTLEEYRNKIATLPGEINGTETAQARMDRIFKQSQETVRGLRGPTAEYEQKLQQLSEQLEAGFIDDEQYAAATAKVRDEMRAADPAAKALAEAMEEGKRVTQELLTPTEKYEQEIAKLKGLLSQGAISEETFARASKKAKDTLDGKPEAVKSVGDAFGGLPGPLGAAARAFDMIQKSLGGTFAAFKSGGISGGVSNVIGQIRSGVANAGSTGGASLVGAAPQIALVATAAVVGVEAVRRLTGAIAEVGSRVERTGQLAERLGISFQQYEILSVAANMAGVETEALAASQTKALKAISAAREGAGAEAEAFAALGISQEQLNSTNPAKLMELAAEKLLAIEDPATRAALAVKVFGKSGNEVLPALAGINAVREGIQRLGGVMNKKDEGRFKALDDAFDNAQRSFTRLGEVLLTPFTEAFANIAEGVAAVAGGISAAFSPVADVLATVLGVATVQFRVWGEAIGLSYRVVGVLVQAFQNGIGAIAEWVSQGTLLAPLFSAASSVATFLYDSIKGIGGWVGFIVQKLEEWVGIKIEPMKAGADTESIEAQMKAQEDTKKAAEEQRKTDESRAKTIKEGILTPYEKLQQQVAELNDLEQKGLLTAEERAAAEAKVRGEFVKQDPIAQAAIKAAEEQKKAAEEIGKEIEKSVKAGKELGAAADPARAAFQSTAEAIRQQVEQGIISPDEAKRQMGEAVDAMNEELKRIGEDQKFAQKIREGLKSEVQKVQEELAAIDANKTLTAEEKEKAKAQIKDKFAGGLPGGAQMDAADKFRADQQRLKDALDAGLIDKDEFKDRQRQIFEELDSSVSDLREKQELNKQPDRRAVGAVDVNSSEGASTFFRLLRGQDDPTKKQLDEMKRQTRLLERVAEAEGEVVQI